MTEAEQLAVPDWIHQLASQIVLGRHGVGNAGVLIQRAFEERLASELFQQRAAVELEHLAELQKLEERERALREAALEMATALRYVFECGEDEHMGREALKALAKFEELCHERLDAALKDTHP